MSYFKKQIKMSVIHAQQSFREHRNHIELKGYIPETRDKYRDKIFYLITSCILFVNINTQTHMYI
jgi:hypothetical protein